MLNLVVRCGLITVLIASFLEAPPPPQGEPQEILLSPTLESVDLTDFTVGEGYDFATRVLGDAWDMSEFTDINQWLNRTGPENALLDIRVQDGIFSAYSSSGGSYFFALYPGYEPGTTNGKIGRRLPINSSLFSCFYLAMQIQNPAAAYYQFTWGDASVVPSVWGMPYGLQLTNEIWKLYRVDLKTWPYISGTPWTGRDAWQNLSIVPSLTGDTPFAIDWLRLTDCSPVYVNLSGLQANTYDLWLEAANPAHSILTVEGFTPQPDGSYAWDVQGIQPGVYTYSVMISGSQNVFQQGQLTIVPTPILQFTQPSPLSGLDYATRFGNPWDMDASDILHVDCADWAIEDGVLKIDTLPPAELPPECIGAGAGEAETHVFLNLPGYGSPAAVRYLSFSHSIDGSLSVIDEGMIVRLFWGLQYNGQVCYYMSRAIALDVGWQTYSVDLYDPWNGFPEAVIPDGCPWKSWREQDQVGPLVLLDIDPNENVSDYTFHQEFDWLRLTEVEQVTQGMPVRIRVLLNKPFSELTLLNFYFTTDLSQPTQNPAPTYPTPIIDAPSVNYLPLAFSLGPNFDPFVQQLPADVTYLWNTRGVAPDEYYICALAGDGYNLAVYCSQAPVQIINP